MSINQVPGDVMRVDGNSRDSQAKQAGQQIYYSIHPGESGMERGYVPVSTNALVGNSSGAVVMEDGRMTAVRRTFCLFTAFDLILTFILWVCYTQLIGDTGWTAFIKQVANYEFQSSLFDTVLLSAVRMTFLLLAYALFRINHWWTVAVTTFLSCAFLIVKIFLFQFSSAANARNPLSYCVLIVSFVLAWVETWFLDFKVLPQEKKIRERLARGLAANERTPLLRGIDQGSVFGDQYYSPLESPAGSDDEDEYGRPLGAGSARQSAIPQETDYPSLGRYAWSKLWTMLQIPDSEWRHETGKDAETGIVHSHQEEGLGKIFRLQGTVAADAKEVWEELVYGILESPRWNSTVLECKCLQVVDDHTDISYTVASEGGGGLVSSRDFVSLRRWGVRNGWYLSSGVAAVHHDMPPQKKYVRGENGPGGWAFRPLPGEPNHCLFVWIMSTNLKGWLPQKLIDTAMAGVLLDFLKSVRAHVQSMKQQPTDSVFLDPPS